MHEMIEVHVVEQEGQRLDVWAAGVFERVGSRAAARKRVRSGRLLLDGEKVESSRFVKRGQIVQLLADPNVPACDVPIEVLYADEVCAIVRKPAGLLVNGNRHRTLEHALPNVLGPVLGTSALTYPRPVHRLDYETAGPVAVARTHEALIAWSKAFEERRVHKRYQAIVVGKFTGSARIDSPLDGRDACSEVRLIESFQSLKTGWCSRVELTPVTGRTHQLRRHLQSIGHSILGDRRYNQGPVYQGKGLFLGCTELGLDHPLDGTPLRVQVEVPAKFISFQLREERRWGRWHRVPHP